MLAKMIANRPSANAAQDFGARIGYVCGKACAVDMAGLAGDWMDAAFQMQCIAGLNPRLRSPLCHFVLSWADTERPSDAEMIDSAHRAVYELGGHRHQYVAAVHRDRPSPHVHIVLNRVHPVTGISLSLSHDYARLEKACRRIEHEMGWARDRGRFDSKIVDGDVLLLPKPTGHWAKKNVNRTRGIRPDGSLSYDPVATMRRCVPSAALYVWTDRPAPFTEGRVHAKVAVADGNSAFLTSANLTGHALEKNMEAGVVISGGHVPAGLRAHLHALIETNVIRKI